MASLLWNSLRSGSLYSADNIANALNVVANVSGNSSKSTKVNAAQLLCVFANDAEEVHGDHCCRRQDQNGLYVWKTAKPWAPGGGRLLHLVVFCRLMQQGVSMSYRDTLPWMNKSALGWWNFSRKSQS